MFLVDCFWNFLVYTGLVYKRGRVVFLGLDNTGKSTLIRILTTGRLSACSPPTFHPETHEFVVGDIKYQAYDLGGSSGARRVWRDYMVRMDALVFLIDAADKDRIPEAKAELSSILANRDLQHLPVLVLANKIDSPRALSEHELLDELRLPQGCTTGKGIVELQSKRPVEVFMCSAVRRQGFEEAFRWLSQYL